MPHGSLIVFVGIDGCGKGTQISLLRRYLEDVGLGYNVVLTKEPGGTRLGQEIRRLMFEVIGSKHMAPGVYQTLGRACHLQNCNDLIQPQLQVGRIVICDRFSPICSFAYEPECAYPDLVIVPDLVIHLHGDPARFQQRAMERTTERHQSTKAWNDPEKLRQIQVRYFERLSKPELLGHWVPIQADNGSPEEIHSTVRLHVQKHLWERGYVSDARR